MGLECLVFSPIWQLPTHARLAWIAAVATQDEHGLIRGSCEGMARIAGLSESEAREAIDLLTLTEEEATKPGAMGLVVVERDGQRAYQVVDGVHRLILSAAGQRRKDAERKRQERARKRGAK